MKSADAAVGGVNRHVSANRTFVIDQEDVANAFAGLIPRADRCGKVLDPIIVDDCGYLTDRLS